ncbi:hypothetical protein Ancab_001982, partial [Ancistrocladus abbreviatus]
MEAHFWNCYFILILFHSIILASSSRGVISNNNSNDAKALLSLKESIDPESSLEWQIGTDVCTWHGVKECLRGR